MKESLQIAGAFVGLIVGAGFASGQEIMQFFTSFGLAGILGGIIATIAFSLLGMALTQLGFQIKTTSHKRVIYHLGGPFFGTILDVCITLFLFGVAVVMFAGAGSALHQMFGIPKEVGSIVMVALTIFTLLLNAERIIKIIAAVTPYLLALIFILFIFSFSSMELSLYDAHTLASQQKSTVNNWLLSALLYVSYNIASGAAFLIVMGGAARNQKSAGFGGFLGGILLGALILLIHISMLVQIDKISGVEMPILKLANEIHPIIGAFMVIILLAMMYNTAVGMLFIFTLRFVPAEKSTFKWLVILFGIIGFFASLVGFTQLVGKLYSIMGYIGFILMIAIVFSTFRKNKNSLQK